MPHITINLPSMLHPANNGNDQITFEADTLQQALDYIKTNHKKIFTLLYDEQDQLREHVLILIEGKNIRWIKDPATSITKSTQIEILQAVSGG